VRLAQEGVKLSPEPLGQVLVDRRRVVAGFLEVL
jgi:hypothetical protein